ncbi:MAG: hypothetical protein J6S78_10035 [Lachnospiraceae bacterium]|nr:hypothetical protein [Lachnospiraceae bacterium]
MVIRIDIGNSDVLSGVATFKKMGMLDYWFYENLEFETGKSYGLISEYMQGCMYVSYLLGGRIEPEKGASIYIDGKKTDASGLEAISWNIEPYYEKYKDFVVRKSVEKALEKRMVPETFEQIAETFTLTEARYDRKLSQLSGERWRASTAIGYASGKKIFFGPYQCSEFYARMHRLPEITRFLTERGCMVVLPAGSDMYLKKFVDQCVYFDKLRGFYDSIQ